MRGLHDHSIRDSFLAGLVLLAVAMIIIGFVALVLDAKTPSLAEMAEPISYVSGEVDGIQQEQLDRMMRGR